MDNNKKLLLLTMHGMGDIKPNYADKLISALQDEIGPNRFDELVHVKVVQYQVIFQDNQKKLWNRIKKTSNVDWQRLREFFLYSFSDPASYLYGAHRDKSVYNQTQKIICDALDRAYEEVGSHAPVVVVAQSLGGHVISDYIWDTEKRKFGIWAPDGSGHLPNDLDKEKFRRLRSLKGLFTTGCNIPLFVAGHAKIEPLKKPNKDFVWHNFYDADDVLGYPLRPLSKGYRDLVKDHEINAGGILTSWSPLSHGEYWSDKDVYRKVARYIEHLL